MTQKLNLVAVNDTEDRLAASEGSSFDYSKLDEETATEAKTAASNISGLMIQVHQNTVEIGIGLGRVHEKFGRHSEKSQLRGEDTWGHWVELEVGISKSRANALIRVGKRFGDLNPGHRLSFDVLTYLSRKSTSQQVVKEVIQRANAGETITLPQAKAIAALESHERRDKSKASECRTSPSRTQDQSALASYEKKHGHHPYESDSRYIRALYAVHELSQIEETNPKKFIDEMRGSDRWSQSDARKLPQAIRFARGVLEAWEAHHGKFAD